MLIGVDIDGVLGDQIADVLPRVRDDYGVTLGHEDITQFRLRIGSTDIAEVIRRAQSDPAYIATMPVVAGAPEMVDELKRQHRVVAVTARPASTLERTGEWLVNNGLVFDDVIAAEEERKSLHGADVLIDDYVGNLVEFLEQGGGLGVLVDQPWNRADRGRLRRWIDSGQCVVARNLAEVAGLVEGYAGNQD